MIRTRYRRAMSSRDIVVLWLCLAALGHLLAGVLLTWAGHGPLLHHYLEGIDRAFWGHDAPPAGRS